MQFDLKQTSPEVAYKLLTATVAPRPIAWVTTRSAAGIDNAAPFSFFNVMGHAPPTLAIGLMRHPERGLKDTARNIIETGDFVVHLVPETLAAAMNATAADLAPDVDELKAAGIPVGAARRVNAPLILDSPVAFECRSLSAIATGPAQVVVIGEVVWIHIADRYVLDAERGHVDTPRLDLISRMHGSGWYARSTDLFELARPVSGKKEKATAPVG